MTPQFKRAVETYGPRFMADLGLSRLHVGGVFGNLAVESAQFTANQEKSPTVKGSRGGWGWPQWTGPRRRAFEAWADANGFKRDDWDGFYAYMLFELRGPEKAALARLKRTKTLDSATSAFMLGYERPGVPHEQKRKDFALEALRVLDAKIGTPPPAADPVVTKPAKPLNTVSPVPIASDAQVMPAPKPGMFTWLFRKRVVAPDSATVLHVQTQLQQRNYYLNGLLDGIDGQKTRDAVAAARKDNGLGDGGIDEAFLVALPKMPARPVSTSRGNLTIPEMTAHAPERAAPPSTLLKIGGLLLGLGGADAAQTSGVLNSVQQTADTAGSVLASLQSVIGALRSVVGFVVEYRWVFIVAAGLWAVLEGVRYFVTLFRDITQGRR
ncbi:phage tail tip lysozyme [Methylobacterium sp. Leaf87]|uniref:phage tail tip lysozyme n=1 Tax=Methylobacterium sp. Leaf87 TaxID=1736243 RepID=UPI000AEC6AD8|nr:phage tail tip lysozyme [Methylobacterium sp. Leaf87]